MHIFTFCSMLPGAMNRKLKDGKMKEKNEVQIESVGFFYSFFLSSPYAGVFFYSFSLLCSHPSCPHMCQCWHSMFFFLLICRRRRRRPFLFSNYSVCVHTEDKSDWHTGDGGFHRRIGRRTLTTHKHIYMYTSSYIVS